MELELFSSFSRLPKMLRRGKSYERNLGRHKVGETHYFYYNFISKNIQSTIFKQSSFLISFPNTFRQLKLSMSLSPNFYLQALVRDQDCIPAWPAQVTEAGVREHRSWCVCCNLVVSQDIRPLILSGDILLTTVRDHYTALHYKTLAGFVWVNR